MILQLFVKSGLYLFYADSQLISFRLQCGDQHRRDEIHVLAQKAFSCHTSGELKRFFVWFYFIWLGLGFLLGFSFFSLNLSKALSK